ncbi:hypothetical protein L1O48_05575 [Ligilactobacillus equi]|uniref:hypothetical protein n=1 Tax=Ligilactobacillus equi TaxID=137357 RepID=UPI002ED1DF3E
MINYHLWDPDRYYRYNHKYDEIFGVVNVVTKLGKIEKREFPAIYCKNCNHYFITEEEYNRLSYYGVVLCKVVKDKADLDNLENGNTLLREKSIYKLFGYSVGKSSTLTAIQRQTILESMISMKIVKKRKS